MLEILINKLSKLSCGRGTELCLSCCDPDAWSNTNCLRHPHLSHIPASGQNIWQLQVGKSWTTSLWVHPPKDAHLAKLQWHENAKIALSLATVESSEPAGTYSILPYACEMIPVRGSAKNLLPNSQTGEGVKVVVSVLWDSNACLTSNLMHRIPCTLHQFQACQMSSKMFDFFVASMSMSCIYFRICIRIYTNLAS